MERDWTLPKARIDPNILKRQKIEHVLLEYDGPEVITLWDPDDRARYLAEASDESDDRIRWVQVPITKGEWVALITGEADLYTLLAKPSLQVVDRDFSESAIEGWNVPLADLNPARDLPDPGATLPAGVIQNMKHLVDEWEANQTTGKAQDRC